MKPEYGPRGIRRKPLKPSALSQLVGSHRLCAHYMGGRVDFRELYVPDSQNHSKSGVKLEEFMVKRFL